MTKDDFNRVMTSINNAFPQKTLDGPMMARYYELLKDLTPAQFKQAADHCCKTVNHFPLVSDLRKAVGASDSLPGADHAPNAAAYTTFVTDDQRADAVIMFWHDYAADPLWSINDKGVVQYGYHHLRAAAGNYLARGKALPDAAEEWARKEGLL